MITDILSEPEKFQSHIQTYAATVSTLYGPNLDDSSLMSRFASLQIVVNLGYGRQDKAQYSDPDIQKIIVGADRLGQVLRPGAWKIDSFPWLKCNSTIFIYGVRQDILICYRLLHRCPWIPQSTRTMGSRRARTVPWCLGRSSSQCRQWKCYRMLRNIHDSKSS